MSKVDKQLAFDTGDEANEKIYRQNYDDDESLEDQNGFANNQEDYDKDERLVVRFVPKVIDYIIFVVQLTILGSYFYVAYIWGGLDDVQCKADINSTVPLQQKTDDVEIDGYDDDDTSDEEWGYRSDKDPLHYEFNFSD